MEEWRGRGDSLTPPPFSTKWNEVFSCFGAVTAVRTLNFYYIHTVLCSAGMLLQKREISEATSYTSEYKHNLNFTQNKLKFNKQVILFIVFINEHKCKFLQLRI